MRFQCPFCSYNMRGITQSMLGRKVRCPDCDKTSRLPKKEYSEGRIIGDFILKRRLGAGSIGAVFFAHQISLDRAVALKVLSKEYSNTKGIEAFLKEARAAAKLSHPNLVQSFGVGEEGGTCFMAMNFIEGETIKNKIEREGKIKVDEALHIVQQVAEGLFFAWTEAGLIHRDVKPENIMITKEGAVKLTDLGLAMKETEWSEDMEISGSPSYMSPEQFTGEKIDTRSDIYSLGISLYQMISGELPFRGETLKSVARQHFYEASKPLTKIDPMIPGKVNQLTQKMIAKEPDKRFRNMEDLIQKIWEVRQTTAPDKDLVPSVHTISIKRLDYELQEISKERKKHTVVKNNLEAQKTDKFKRVLAISLPFVVALGILWLIMYSQTQNANSEMASKVNAFEELLSYDSKEINELETKWKETKESMSSAQNDYQRELHSRMDIYHEQIKNKYLIKINAKLKDFSKTKDNETSQKLQELLKKNREAEQVIERKEAELKRREDEFKARENEFIVREEEFKKKIQQQDNKKNKLGKTAEEMRKINEKMWKDDIRLNTTFRLVSKREFDEAENWLKVEEKDYPNQKEWFDKRHQEIKDLDKLYKALTMSGSTYAGVELKEGVLKDIFAEKVRYTNEDEELIEEDWSKLDFESHLAIAVKVFPDENEDKIKAYLHILSGKIIDAAEVYNNPEMQATGIAICEYRMKKIKRKYLLNPSEAREEAKDFLKYISPSETMLEKYKPQLITLFAGE